MNTSKEDGLVKTVMSMYELKEARKPRAHPEVTKMLDKVSEWDADTYEDLLYRLALRTKEDSKEIEDKAFASAAMHLMQAWKAYAGRDGN